MFVVDKSHKKVFVLLIRFRIAFNYNSSLENSGITLLIINTCLKSTFLNIVVQQIQSVDVKLVL